MTGRVAVRRGEKGRAGTPEMLECTRKAGGASGLSAKRRIENQPPRKAELLRERRDEVFRERRDGVKSARGGSKSRFVSDFMRNKDSSHLAGKFMLLSREKECS